MAKAAPAVGVHSRRVLLVVAGAFVALGVLIALASVAEHALYSGAILPGVRIDGAHIGGKKEATARADITRLGAQLDSTPIRAHAGDQKFVVDPALIGFRVDVDATINAADEAGRHTNPLSMVADTVLRRFRPDVVPVAVQYDAARFQGLLDGWSNAVRSGLVEGDLRFDGTTVIPVSPHAGRGLLRDDAQRMMEGVLHSGVRTDVALPIGDLLPKVDQAAVSAAAGRARALLTGKYVVVAGATRVTLTPAQIAPALGTRVDGHRLDLTVDGNRLRLALGTAFGAVEQPPVDASFNINGANEVSVVPSVDGHQLDTDAIAAAIVRGDRTITANIRNEHPQHDTKWAEALGITHQVSSFTTYYMPGQPRVHNIHLAADTLNNTIVVPGATFSLNERLGQRTPDKGYVQAPIETENGFGQDYGGGISQLTTTLFNAVFFGGYVDVDHSPHHYYVSRYPMGREATIVWPYVDLKFRNDTRHGVLIRATYSDTSVTVTFFGDTDGRNATEANRQILHTEQITDRLVPCPATKPADDPNNSCATLAAGALDQTTSGETGYDVEFDRVITKPGRPTEITHYRVHYPMLQNTVLVGTAPATTTTTTMPTPTTKPTTPKTTTTAKRAG